MVTREKVEGMYRKMGTCHPKLLRGQVWCRTCGATIKVDSGKCIRWGWPLCCGETMTIDSPEERAALSAPPHREEPPDEAR